ncbi:predicted protein [Naegleria gruberi]|uniref:Predicted protein n=1 Tax=Naegleria gruberi TaxID=5762 RepID=D2W0N3_NAEGR|nr:uncharacterized protein NAEGRDRAFT_76508 [Naegleria gruberi]XP_002670064.1 uncharacterized protein NAEGRDRAFT_74920 [Naegleria gruberi]EFC35834.1 predicted protein [Naegleria gruberi]EFC37320.1 predicted protein [Naegleria gruberi]|eukprot:XP_002668578.1 predicted protein [Naegleria gruberi strain NEG-M]
MKIVAFKVLKTIKTRATKTNKQQSQRPIIKVITLQLALVFSALSQIIAIGCATALDDWSYMTLFYNFINSAGILTFGIVTVLLYQPIFTESARAVKELNNQSETSSGRKKSLFKKAQTIPTENSNV